MPLPYLSSLPNRRMMYFLVAGACLAMMIAALIMQHMFEMEPCPLCITQRVFVILAGVVALAAGAHNCKGIGNKIYASLGGLVSIIGGGVSTRHVWLQNLPEDQVPTCGPGLSYMFDALPLWEALSLLFAGDGNCAEESWRFLGLTIPGWTLLCFLGLLVIFIWQLLRKPGN